ncbi:hypothetical protein CTAYLR_001979 [Chrysophaeum taylorii]|uniref:Uncharacterized protein n=1 Tax=Chrysophaeum taylorii TaxID=2483200 RepID=A0AAD7XJA5_9STRA|nr:hypothetical protein CTAYLR_001979 [Chrysophaeum taylorii]
MMRLLVLVSAALSAHAFTIPARSLSVSTRHALPRASSVARRQPNLAPARASVQMGLFGLGMPEIAVILGIAGFILGPEKLTSMAKDFGKIAGDLKEVPKEFAEGMKESEQAQAALQTKETPEPKEDTVQT